MIGRRTIERASQLVLYGNCFIALCAAAATYQTQLLAGANDWHYTVFIFCATFVFYNIQRLFLSRDYTSTGHSDRHRWIRAHATLILLLSFACAIAAIVALQAELAATAIAFSVLAGLALCYFVPHADIRHIPFAKTIYIGAIWAGATCALPLLAQRNTPPLITVALLTTERFLFILALCIVFDIRDMEVDRQTGVKTLPVAFGVRATKRAAMVATVLFFATAVFRLSIIAAGNGSELLALTLSALITLAVISRAEASSPEFFYLFTVDSMILLQAELCVGLR